MAYYRRCAVNAGVPEDDLDDACQDIAIRVWKSHTPYVNQVIRRAAIDAARKYGPHTRYGTSRVQLPIEHALSLAVPDVLTAIVARDERAERRAYCRGRLRVVAAAIRLLPAGQRQALMRGLRETGDLDRDASQRRHARRRLRQLCA